MKSDLSALPAFVAVAEGGSFAAAAEKLHLTRSAVSKIVSRLEARLGVMLFMRTTRSLSLTDEGALYYEHCRQALANIQAAEHQLDSGKMQVSGRLRVSVPVLFGHLCIAPLLTALANEHPLLALEISFSDRRIDLVDEGFDLAVRIGELADSGSLIARRLGEHGMLLCASPDYLWRSGEPSTLDALSRHQAVGYLHAGTVLPWQLRGENGELQSFRPPAKMMMDDMQGIVDAVSAGAGIAWLPEWLVRDRLVAGTLVEIMRGESSLSFPVNVVWPYMPYQPLKVRLAVDKLVAELPGKLALAAPVISYR
ncbi:LysR family transcriptional regulator [Serratia marcescens]|jgi:DNA-binding transcriptional LysR family regulator|uniref:LysR family transcriptional regulator n=1 Tax=Serratia marcescens TaxID=615 RepID=A0AA46K500_SERMA|nr:LysR family transcriptional regulator [Serratia marcescens]MBH3199253.1 LysR family transcriptional regulator [Serratia marcescens]MBI6123363.1 LysR family transcriptional regulator [Serratia marcescens]QLJ66577.1 LysR family transcriptional regulator [Serratia marcescens]TQI83825.1 LysR family transcriptional regulator [Serratia marcescens]BEM43797.1 LysR family transcriptional regulator [Serratia marcescens]